jgi:hypothetical protein
MSRERASPPGRMQLCAATVLETMLAGYVRSLTSTAELEAGDL